MSRPTAYWYGYVEKVLSRYPKQLREDATPQAAIAELAIKTAIDQTLKEYWDGKSRVDLISMVYIKKTHTLTGAAGKLYISERTAKRWKKKFILLVAKNMGLVIGD